MLDLMNCKLLNGESNFGIKNMLHFSFTCLPAGLLAGKWQKNPFDKFDKIVPFSPYAFLKIYTF